MNTTKLRWTDGHPKDAGVIGFVWVVDEEGSIGVGEIDSDYNYIKAKGVGRPQAWAGPLEPPDEDTLP